MAVQGQMLTFNVRRFKPFRQTSSFLGEAQNKTPQHKTPNCQPLRSFSPSSRLETDCYTGKFTRRSSVRALFRIRSEIMRLLSHCRA